MERPLVSIITSSLNSVKTIEQTINSVINQTYPNIEYIIIDGGSTDGTLKIVEKYVDKLTYWVSEPDNGVFEAWNKGIKNSTGDWITFIGADDTFYPQAIEQYIMFINGSNEKFEFLSSKMHIVNADGQIIRTLGSQWDWQKSRKRFNIAHPGSLHAAGLFEKIGVFNTKYKICGDYELLLRLGENIKAGFMDKVTLRMSLGGLSDTGKVLIESNKVIRCFGKVGFFEAAIILTIQYLKLFARKSLFRLKIYPYKK